MISIATWNINSVRLRMRSGRAVPDRAGARRAVPAGNQVRRGRCSRTTRSRRWAIPTARSTGRRAITASPPSAACRCARFSRHDWQDNGEARHVGVELLGPGQGMVLENVYIPAGGDIPDRDGQSQVRPEARFPRADDPLGRRSSTARRCSWAISTSPRSNATSRSQGAAQGGQPHAARGRDAGHACAMPTAGSILAASTSPRRSATDLVVLSHLLAGEGSRAPARPHVGLARAGRAVARPPGRRGNPRAGSSRSDHVPLITEFDL